MRTAFLLAQIKDDIAVDEDGVEWVRATVAMRALGLNRSTYIRWAQRGHCPSLRTIDVPRQSSAPHGEVTVLKVSELVEAYRQHVVRRRWMRQDEEFVEDWYGVRSNQWIAEQLSRTPKSVEVKAHKLGLDKRDVNGLLAPRDIAQLCGLTRQRVARFLSRHPRICTRPRTVSRYMVVKPSRLLKHLKLEPKLWGDIEPRRQRYLEQLAERN